MTQSEFQALPIFEQRVLLAKDILEQLALEKFIELNMVYFTPQKTSTTSARSAKEVLEEETCYVCAKGAIAAAWVKRFNRYSVYNIHNSDANLDEIKLIFGRLFSVIECLFEGWGVLVDDFEVECGYRCSPWYDRSWSIKEIMENIIENGGKLKFSYNDRVETKIHIFE